MNGPRGKSAEREKEEEESEKSREEKRTLMNELTLRDYTVWLMCLGRQLTLRKSCGIR